MATKKQKREAALQKHQDRMDELRDRGAKALRMDRERRAAELRSAWQKNHDKNHSWRQRIPECPICQDELKLARKAGQDVVVTESPDPIEELLNQDDEEDLAETG